MIRHQMWWAFRAGTTEESSGELPFESRSELALELAQMYASELGHDYIGTEHFLMGLVREPRGIAGWALRHCGLTIDDAREAVLKLMGAGVREEPVAERILPQLHAEDGRVAPLLALAAHVESRKEEAIEEGKFDAARRLRGEVAKLRTRVLGLCRDLEFEAQSLRLPKAPLASGLLEFEPPDDVPLHTAYVKEMYQGLVAGTSVLLVGPPGSGRMSLARSLAYELCVVGAGDGVPARLLRLDPMLLADLSLEELEGCLLPHVQEDDLGSKTFLAVPDLERFCDPQPDSVEVAVLGRRIAEMGAAGRVVSLSWTTPAGLERVCECFPGFAHSCTILRLSMDEDALAAYVSSVLRTFAAVHNVQFEDGFVREILHHRLRWKSHTGTGDPGRCLLLLRGVVRRENRHAVLGHDAEEDRCIRLTQAAISTALNSGRLDDAERRIRDLRRLQDYGLPLQSPTPGRDILRTAVQRFVDWDNGPAAP